MGRHPHPEMVRLTARVPRGQDGFWQIIRALDAKGPWTVNDVHGETNVRHRATVQDYVYRLEKAGIAAVVGSRSKALTGSKEKLYRLNKRPAATPSLRRDGTPYDAPAQQRLWTAIRSMKSFAVRELAYAAAGSSGPVPFRTTIRYVVHLASAGYLASLGGGGYRLKPSMNTGPAAPKILRMHVVWDVNRNESVGGDTIDAEAVE